MAAGRLTARALTEHCLARIEVLEPQIRAWVHVDAEGARAAADAADAHREAGRPLGPLHGVPIGLKDNIDVAGLPAERGAAHDAGRIAETDATMVHRLRAAGAVILGKTVTTELAGYPPSKTRNPHDASRTPGGSSAGSAAAVAAGMVPLAFGSQTNGSIIRPASFCGVYGFKPSFGFSARTGVLSNAASLDHLGPISRALEDMSLVEVLAGADGTDADALPYTGPLAATAASEPPVRPAIAYLPTHAWGEAEESTHAAFAELTGAIDGIVDTVPLPESFTETPRLIRTIMAVEGARHLGHYLDAEATIAPQNRELIAGGRATSPEAYGAALAARDALRAGLAEIFERYDAVLTPAVPGEAPGAETTGSPAFCSLWSLTGLPSLTLPLMTGPAGLPLGVQLAGPMGDDARLLRTARWLVRHLDPGDAP